MPSRALACISCITAVALLISGDTDAMQLMHAKSAPLLGAPRHRKSPAQKEAFSVVIL